MRDARVESPTRAWLAIPAPAFALVALTVGLVARQTVQSPYWTPFFHLFFSAGSSRGAVTTFLPSRFPGPPSEPDMRVTTHPLDDDDLFTKEDEACIHHVSGL